MKIYVKSSKSGIQDIKLTSYREFLDYNTYYSLYNYHANDGKYLDDLKVPDGFNINLPYTISFSNDDLAIQCLDDFDFAGERNRESSFIANAQNFDELENKANDLLYRYNDSLHSEKYRSQMQQVMTQVAENIDDLNIRYLKVKLDRRGILGNPCYFITVWYKTPDKFKYESKEYNHNSNEIYKMLTSIDALCDVTKDVTHNANHWRNAYYKVGSTDATVRYIPQMVKLSLKDT